MHLDIARHFGDVHVMPGHNLLPWQRCIRHLLCGLLQGVENWLPWDTNPLYAIMHESIYCQHAASQWAAQRVRDSSYASAFDAVRAANANETVMFTGKASLLF